ncbi:MAG: DUF11 domain-containing protein [Candidatus Doudnabacteria bacterium]|nr:DUF11 domain-containing protein [Candidatus Doudnabacteria bacterium]
MPNDNDQIFDDKSRLEIPVEYNQPEPKWKQSLKNKTVIFSTIAAVLAVAAIAWYFLGGNDAPKPTSNNVVLLIKGPDQLMSGNEAEYRVVYRNGENADLTNISLEMFYPSGFKFKSATPTASSLSGAVFNLPVLREGKDGEVVIRGKLSGSTGEDKQIKAVLHYRMSNFNSEFAVEQTIKTSILPPNLTMDINGPVDVVNGQDTTYTVTFTNVTSQNFDNLALQLAYPEGFTFTSSVPPPSKNNNYWTIPKLSSNSSVSIDITGSFAGSDNETKLVKADLGQIINNTFAPQLTSTATFKLIPSALAISISSDVKNGVVKLGNTINYKINYINQGSIGLNNLIIVVNLDGTALDMPKLAAPDAIVSGRTLTWKAATLPGLSVLSPSEKGEIRFSIPLVQSSNTNLKNQVVRASAMISSQEIIKPTKAPDVSLKLGTQLDLVVNGDFISGAAPMQVGKSTLFGMTLMLSNLSNDVSNTKVVASLPLPVSAWKDVIIPEAERNRLSYDPNSGKITWNIGDLAAFTGRYSPVARVSFQLEVNPTEVDKGKDMDLLNDVQATGTDTFTNLEVKSDNVRNVSTSNIDDDVLNTKGTTVQD